ncbi:hypothetical protein V8C86DRAFT_2599505 [Haematococcus lacustris]
MMMITVCNDDGLATYNYILTDSAAKATAAKQKQDSTEQNLRLSGSGGRKALNVCQHPQCNGAVTNTSHHLPTPRLLVYTPSASTSSCTDLPPSVLLPSPALQLYTVPPLFAPAPPCSDLTAAAHSTPAICPLHPAPACSLIRSSCHPSFSSSSSSSLPTPCPAPRTPQPLPCSPLFCQGWVPLQHPPSPTPASSIWSALPRGASSHLTPHTSLLTPHTSGHSFCQLPVLRHTIAAVHNPTVSLPAPLNPP